MGDIYGTLVGATKARCPSKGRGTGTSCESDEVKEAARGGGACSSNMA